MQPRRRLQTDEICVEGRLGGGLRTGGFWEDESESCRTLSQKPLALVLP